MAGLIKWKAAAIPAGNPDPGAFFVGIDIADDMFYVKDSAGVVTKFPTLTQVEAVVLATELAGFATGDGTAVVATDTVLEAFGKLQTQINNLATFKDKVYSTSGLINQTTTLEEYISLSTTIPALGDYKLSWSYTWSSNDGSLDFVARIQQNNAGANLMDHRQEPKDTGGTGIVLPVIGGGTANTGTDQRHHASGFVILENLAAGAQQFDLDFAGSAANIEPAIYYGGLTIERFD